jgi:hypothetical protein
MSVHGLLQRYLYFLYANDVRPSQEKCLWISTACYRDSFTCYMHMMFVPHWKHKHKPPRSVTGIAFLVYT